MKTKYIFRTLLMAVGLLMGTMSAKAAYYEDANGTSEIVFPWGTFDDYNADAVFRITYKIQPQNGWTPNYAISYTTNNKGEIRRVSVSSDGTIEIPIAGYNTEENNVAGLLKGEWVKIYKVEIYSSSPAVTKYTLTYVSQGSVFKTEKLAEGETPNPPADPVRYDGWTFDHWDNLPATMPNHDVEATATFSPPVRKIFWRLNNDNNDIVRTDNVTLGDPIPAAPVVNRTGYVFNGWNMNGVPSTMPNYDVTIDGTTTKAYTVSFVIGGQTVASVELADGATITVPDVEIPAGHRVVWGDNGSYPDKVNGANVTIVGQFVELPKYTLTYSLYNEVTYSYDIVYDSYEIYEGYPTQVPENDPERDGYTFSGWDYIPSTMPSEDFTVQGRYRKNYMPQSPVWQESSVTYAVPEGASFYSGQTIEVKSESGNTVATLTYGESGGEVFNTAVASGAIDAFGAYTPGNGTNGNESGGTFYTITANYDGFIAVGVVLNKDKALYIEEDGVALDDYNGKVNKTKYKGAYGFKVKAGSTYKIYASGSKLGFFGFKYDYSTTKYTLTYKVDGQTYHVDRLEEGVTPTLPADPTKVGYRFVGWTGVPSVMPAEAVTAEAEFTINTYKLTYKVDGVEVASYDYEYGASITPIEYAVSGGQVFSGWNNLPTKMPAYDVEVEGRVLKEIQQVQITISSSTGYATFSYNEPMDFTNVTGLQAYIVKQVNETTATLEQVTGIIAAGTGLIVKGYTAVVPTSNTSLGVSPSGNLLVGVTGSSHTIQSATEFVLTEVNGEARFQATEGHAAVIPENHAYLSTPSSSRTLRIVMADKTTEIDDMPVAEKAPLIIYDLRGHRVPNPKKGTLYIVNGKQTVWK